MFARIVAVMVAASFAFTSLSVHADVTLHWVIGGSGQRLDIVRGILDAYEKENPGVKVTTEASSATSDQQRQYLSTVLNAKDSALDVFMIDVVNPAQYLTAGWVEPLDAHLGPASEVMKPYLPVYAKANVVNGKIAALPAFADGMFLYYRKDLLEKYGLPQPATWTDLASAAKSVLAGEKNPALQGLSIQGAPIEGAVCTFLLPYWSQRKELTDASGSLTLDKGAAVAGMNMWMNLMDQGVIKRNIAEVKTGDTVTEFKAGQAVYAVSWSFAWAAFQNDADSAVKGKVGVMPLPSMPGGDPITCVGGWQWSVSAFSAHKPEAAKLVRYLSSPAVSKTLAVRAALLPVYADVYKDAEVLARNPWFDSAGDILAKTGHERPVTPRYGEVSDTIRTTASAMLGRSVPVAEGVDQIDSRLRRILR
jgi:multiple sugar transport system substrate-binding protein